MIILSVWRDIITNIAGEGMSMLRDKTFLLRLALIILSIGLLIINITMKKRRENVVNDERTYYDFAMGTSVAVLVYPGKASDASSEQLSLELIEDIQRLDEEVISYRVDKSETSRLNAGLKSGEKIAVSDELMTIIKGSYRICEDSDGALDITLGPLLSCWNIETATAEDFVVPEKDDIERSLEETGYEKLIMDEGENSIHASSPISLNFGSTGKGYALDIIRQKLEEEAVTGALISVGGSVLAYGKKPDGEAWRIGIRNPRKSAEDMIGYLEFEAEPYICISTSGDYEKYIEKDGIRYHHILDRASGAPARSGLSSVTVVSRYGIDSDGLSTACFVLGIDKSYELLSKYNAEAVFVDENGVVTVTDGLKDNYKGN